MSVEFTFFDFFQPFSILHQKDRFDRQQWLSYEELRSLQNDKLKSIIQHAYAHVPYYRNVFDQSRLTPADIRQATDLIKLPLLKKETVQENPADLQADNKNKFHPRPHHTSGSSGKKLEFLLDRQTNVLEFVYYWRHWNGAGYHLGASFVEFSSTFFMKPGREKQLIHRQRGTGRILVNSVTLSAKHSESVCALLKSEKVKFLKGLPSVIYYFCRFLNTLGLSAPHLIAVFSQGEVLYPFQRKEIEKTFGCKVFDSYGQMERIVAINECSHGSLHANMDYGHLELIPLKNEGSKELRAQMVGTSLFNYSMPFLRYDLGDIAHLDPDPGPCPCGRSFPRIKSIEGRSDDVVVTPEGHIVTTLFLAFDETPHILAGQIIQDSISSLQVRLKPSPQFNSSDQEQILGFIQQAVGKSMKINLELIDSSKSIAQQNGKTKVILSRLNSDRFI